MHGKLHIYTFITNIAKIDVDYYYYYYFDGGSKSNAIHSENYIYSSYVTYTRKFVI